MKMEIMALKSNLANCCATIVEKYMVTVEASGTGT
jgi:hypothetical protein